MLDTSYGFNNLLKEVTPISHRDTNISQDSKKSSSKTSTHAKKSAAKSKGLSDPSVRHTLNQKDQQRHLNTPNHWEPINDSGDLFGFFKFF